MYNKPGGCKQREAHENRIDVQCLPKDFDLSPTLASILHGDIFFERREADCNVMSISKMGNLAMATLSCLVTIIVVSIMSSITILLLIASIIIFYYCYCYCYCWGGF